MDAVADTPGAATLPLGPLYALLQDVHGERADYSAEVGRVYTAMTQQMQAEGSSRPGRVAELLLSEARAGLPDGLVGRFDEAWARYDTEENRSFLYLGYQAEAMLRLSIERQRQVVGQ